MMREQNGDSWESFNPSTNVLVRLSNDSIKKKKTSFNRYTTVVALSFEETTAFKRSPSSPSSASGCSEPIIPFYRAGMLRLSYRPRTLAKSIRRPLTGQDEEDKEQEKV